MRKQEHWDSNNMKRKIIDALTLFLLTELVWCLYGICEAARNHPKPKFIACFFNVFAWTDV